MKINEISFCIYIIPVPWGKCYTNNTQKYNSFIVIFAIRHI
nr:MAG TPA: hypothetical protein [Caudoviricetes sp.]